MDNFIEQCKRTESPKTPLTYHREHYNRLLHAAMGLCTESGEFLDALKKNLFYDKPLNSTNLNEELGDILWHLAIAIDAVGSSFAAEMDRVIRKLRVRYPERFTEEAANNRDLGAEEEELRK